jgi:hypothetical protein
MIGFSLCSSVDVVPNFAAMLDRVSPAATVYSPPASRFPQYYEVRILMSSVIRHPGSLAPAPNRGFYFQP